MLQRRDNAGAVCDSDMGMLVLNCQFFVLQKATAPKNGVEFCQGSIGNIRSSQANVIQRLARSRDATKFQPIRGQEIISDTHTHTQTENQHTVRSCSTSSACQKI